MPTADELIFLLLIVMSGTAFSQAGRVGDRLGQLAAFVTRRSSPRS